MLMNFFKTKNNTNICYFITFYTKNMDAKPLCIRFNKVDGVIEIYNGIRYLELSNLHNEVCYRINSRIYNTKF